MESLIWLTSLMIRVWSAYANVSQDAAIQPLHKLGRTTSSRGSFAVLSRWLSFDIVEKGFFKDRECRSSLGPDRLPSNKRAPDFWRQLCNLFSAGPSLFKAGMESKVAPFVPRLQKLEPGGFVLEIHLVP